MEHDLQGGHYLESLEIDREEAPHEVSNDPIKNASIHEQHPGWKATTMGSMIPAKKWSERKLKYIFLEKIPCLPKKL